ncbi:MAG: PAS domain S-box protein [Chloroflexi bacterium]|nr:PAS domain S-box protein [Chloroflexota bacterium]
MVSQVIRALAAPTFTDDDQTRSAQLVNASLFLIGAGIMVGLVAAGLSGDGAILLPVFVVFLIGLSVLRYLLYRRHLRLATLLTVALTWVVTTFAAWMTGGVYSPTNGAYVVIILMTGILLGARWAVGYAGLSSLSVLSMVYLNSTASQDTLLPPINIWVSYTVTFIVPAIVVGLAIVQMNAAMRRTRQSETSAQGFQEKLKVLHQVSLTLANTDNFDDLCQTAIQLGRSHLGFDRLSLWLVDEDLDKMIGSFGTDETGQLRDERGIRMQIPQAAIFREILSGKMPLHLWPNVPLYNHHSEIVGDGWNAVAVLWGRDSGIGWLSTDNLLHQQPTTPQQLELLVLYGSTLGHLITRKRTEEALRVSEEKYRILYSNTPVMMHSIDSEGKLIGVNNHWLASLGYEREEVIGRKSVEFLTPESRQYAEEMVLPEYFRTGVCTNISYQFVKKSGEIMDVLLSAIAERDTEGNFVRSLAVLMDVTERRHTEQALQASEERYRALYRDNPSMLFTVDREGVVISVNDFGASQLGYKIDELEGQSVLKVFHEDDKAAVTGQLQQCLQHPGNVYQWQFRKVRKDGSILWVEEFARAVTGPTGEANVLVVCQDITERKQAEQQRMQLALEKEKVSFLQDFLGSMAHDLKTPITVMKINLSLLEQLDDPLKQQQRVKLIDNQLTFVTQVVDDVLTVARLETLPDLVFRSANINRLVTNIQYNLRPKFEHKALAVTVDLDNNLPTIQANEEELQRALINLIENAINYTPEQGSVKIRTYHETDQVIIEVTDTGIGISTDELSRIFDQFYRASNANEGGTGLGLAIARKVIDLHHGAIEVQSVLGQGTTFRVALPVTS